MQILIIISKVAQNYLDRRMSKQPSERSEQTFFPNCDRIILG